MSCAKPLDPPADNADSAVDDPEPDDTSDGEPKRCADDRTWVQVSAGSEQTCGLHGNGCIECWGGEARDGELNVPDTGRVDWVDFGDDEPPNGTYSYIAIAQDGGASGHGCALDPTGRVSCWGRDDFGQSSPPSGSFSYLSLNRGFSCGIRTDTTLACWGLFSGLGGLPTERGFVSMHAGLSGYSCAVNEGGYVACWQYEQRFADQAGHFNSVGIDWRVCASSFDAPILCWDAASDGESVVKEGVPTDPGFAHLCQSFYFGCALGADGRVDCWGIEHDVPSDTMFSQISCGSQHACGVTLDGAIECWGNCYDGECDPPP